jgi:hypothetical protein
VILHATEDFSGMSNSSSYAEDVYVGCSVQLTNNVTHLRSYEAVSPRTCRYCHSDVKRANRVQALVLLS